MLLIDEMSRKSLHDGRCTVQGCPRRHYGKGYCKLHYDRVRYHGDTERKGPNGRKCHGMTKSHRRFMAIYSGIGRRCNNPKSPSYRNYGAKGIKRLWSTFDEFRDDMLEEYVRHVEKHGVANTTIERMDNAKGYCKSNCRWATRSEQIANRSCSIRIFHRGETRLLKHWCHYYKVSYLGMRHRMTDLGMTFEQAVVPSIDRALSQLRRRMVH